ncbi:MAG: cell division protein FtsX [Proteobacteria bacterium]|nr:cell division protein FtsX [Pseudomonadota bacterium]
MQASTRRPIPNRPNSLTRFRALVREHLRSLVFSLGKLYRHPFASTLTILMIAVALALPACMYLLLDNLQTVTEKWDDSGQITLFLNVDSSEAEIKALRTRLAELKEIESIKYVSAQQALAEFRKLSRLEYLIEGLEENPLPPTLTLIPFEQAKQAGQLDRLVQDLGTYPQVDHVQLDLQWLQRLQAITEVVHRAITILGITLAISVLLVVGNSIRLDIENRREEIEVAKLIGATNRFVRRPFLYGGMWYGLLGGSLALLLVLLVLYVIEAPAQHLIGLYNSNFELIFPDLRQGLALIATSIVLGLLGSWLAVGRHIVRIEPS